MAVPSCKDPAHPKWTASTAELPAGNQVGRLSVHMRKLVAAVVRAELRRAGTLRARHHRGRRGQGSEEKRRSFWAKETDRRRAQRAEEAATAKCNAAAVRLRRRQSAQAALRQWLRFKGHASAMTKVAETRFDFVDSAVKRRQSAHAAAISQYDQRSSKAALQLWRRPTEFRAAGVEPAATSSTGCECAGEPDLWSPRGPPCAPEHAATLSTAPTEDCPPPDWAGSRDRSIGGSDGHSSQKSQSPFNASAGPGSLSVFSPVFSPASAQPSARWVEATSPPAMLQGRDPHAPVFVPSAAFEAPSPALTRARKAELERKAQPIDTDSWTSRALSPATIAGLRNGSVRLGECEQCGLLETACWQCLCGSWLCSKCGSLPGPWEPCLLCEELTSCSDDYSEDPLSDSDY